MAFAAYCERNGMVIVERILFSRAQNANPNVDQIIFVIQLKPIATKL
jgi:hypothetical protein